MKKFIFILLGIIVIASSLYAAKALSNSTRELYINRMVKIHRYAVEIVDILSVPDTLELEVIGKNVKVP